jgi:magnesium-transporting ATPase (P-type)
MLTGDKGETAKEIGNSCGIFERDDFPVFNVDENEENLQQQLKSIESTISTIKTQYGFMVAGS